MLKETIVVEGKKDAIAVRRALEADIIITSGFGLTREMIKLIKTAQERNGVIVFTDPDYMGETIRKKIADRVEGVKHAFISREDAYDKGDIGVENASPESIIRALSMAKKKAYSENPEFSMKDMLENNLTISEDAFINRTRVGAYLGIGYANTKQFLNRLNHYGITREEFYEAVNLKRGERI